MALKQKISEGILFGGDWQDDCRFDFDKNVDDTLLDLEQQREAVEDRLNKVLKLKENFRTWWKDYNKKRKANLAKRNNNLDNANWIRNYEIRMAVCVAQMEKWANAAKNLEPDIKALEEQYRELSEKIEDRDSFLVQCQNNKEDGILDDNGGEHEDKDFDWDTYHWQKENAEKWYRLIKRLNKVQAAKWLSIFKDRLGRQYDPKTKIAKSKRNFLVKRDKVWIGMFLAHRAGLMSDMVSWFRSGTNIWDRDKTKTIEEQEALLEEKKAGIERRDTIFSESIMDSWQTVEDLIDLKRSFGNPLKALGNIVDKEII